jgi:hypothetical protein
MGEKGLGRSSSIGSSRLGEPGIGDKCDGWSRSSGGCGLNVEELRLMVVL